VKVSWTLGQDSVEVAVSDGGGRTLPKVNQPSSWSLGGRGLGIVDRLSLRWGVCVATVGQDRHDRHDRHDGQDRHDTRDSPDGQNGDASAGQTTVWAELPVRYGSSAGLVIASSRDA
jgi:hypothetical protein